MARLHDVIPASLAGSASYVRRVAECSATREQPCLIHHAPVILWYTNVTHRSYPKLSRDLKKVSAPTVEVPCLQLERYLYCKIGISLMVAYGLDLIWSLRLSSDLEHLHGFVHRTDRDQRGDVRLCVLVASKPAVAADRDQNNAVSFMM